MTNEKKLAEMVEAVMNNIATSADRYNSPSRYDEISNKIRTALAPFCEELSDEEIRLVNKVHPTNDRDWNETYLEGFEDGAKFYRDR